ncbi:GFA family protein [Pseudoxanthomonas sp. UTMC 1351]|uniref:GFA family protein n=1 Tax=Pseudoxanthomonas sp. UTMC 1351 TaxID=2695853 RepID=UPI0034CE8D72
MSAAATAQASGSCLCGGVRYRFGGELGPIMVCHCSRCRKANGSAFQATSPVAKVDFQLQSGQELLAEYESSPGVFRVFCRICASPLYSRRTATPDVLRLRIGSLDTPVASRPALHIFTASKAEWHDIHGDAPQYAEGPTQVPLPDQHR